MVGNHIAVSDVKWAMPVVVDDAIGIRRHDVERQVDGIASSRCVGCEGDVFFVEAEISLLAQSVADVLSGLVELVAVEQHVLVQYEF